ncbi:MAG: formate dehydrogenase accessory sulfurtransferase FdhD [Nitrospirae bacterium]|nr:formate dehydrogenase accessory sulfurtransferase FdhD [Nitrospirota bacterium]
MNPTSKKIISRITGSSMKQAEDTIAAEQRLRISVNKEEIISLYCTPLMIRELVVGLLMTEGIIRGEWCADRMSIEYGDDVVVNIQAADAVISKEGRVMTSGCVGGITFAKKPETEKIKDEFSIDAESLFHLFKEFQNRSELYHLTGCVHSAALSDGRNIIAFAEDIGRHNAVDKIIGYSLLEAIKFEGKIMLASGRLSSEIASKCSRWGIPVLASRTAPTDLAVEIAEKRGITLAGFVRGERLNVYTHPQRIIISNQTK